MKKDKLIKYLEDILEGISDAINPAASQEMTDEERMLSIRVHLSFLNDAIQVLKMEKESE